MAEVINIDVCVIGGGTGRLSVADGFVQMGAETFLIAQSKMCGDCLNTGCIPSTALLAASKAANAPFTITGKKAADRILGRARSPSVISANSLTLTGRHCSDKIRHTPMDHMAGLYLP